MTAGMAFVAVAKFWIWTFTGMMGEAPLEVPAGFDPEREDEDPKGEILKGLFDK